MEQGKEYLYFDDICKAKGIQLKESFSFEEFCQKITNNVPFVFSRFGDGEWHCVFKALGITDRTKKDFNTDGHTYFQSLGEALNKVVMNNRPYYFGLQALGVDLMGHQITKHIRKLSLNIVNSDIMHIASIQGNFDQFFHAIRSRRRAKIALVGKKSLAKLLPKFNFNLIEIPEKNCWESADVVRSALKQETSKGVDIILYCASMMAEVLMDEVYEKNPLTTQIDCGSVFDPYIGESTRRYHNNMRVS